MYIKWNKRTLTITKQCSVVIDLDELCDDDTWDKLQVTPGELDQLKQLITNLKVFPSYVRISAPESWDGKDARAIAYVYLELVPTTSWKDFTWLATYTLTSEGWRSDTAFQRD